jgi:hypothetical protein
MTTLDPATFAYDHGVLDNRTDRAVEVLTLYAAAWRFAIRDAMTGVGVPEDGAPDPLARLRELAGQGEADTCPARGQTSCRCAVNAPEEPARDWMPPPVLAAALRAPLVPMTEAERAAVAEVTSDPATWQSTEEFMAKIEARAKGGGRG